MMELWRPILSDLVTGPIPAMLLYYEMTVRIPDFWFGSVALNYAAHDQRM
jgi:hypothetical protein